MKIRIATRKSALALWQANFVAEQLNALPAVDETTLLPISTRGDEILDRSLQKVGGKGLFTKELEVAMQNGVADIAVHSMKDVPAELPAGFCIAAVLARADYSDALVSRNGERLGGLRAGAIVGTSSLRRQAQLRMLRSDLDIRPLRGNVNTRLSKLQSGEYDAIVLAAAGLERLGFSQQISQSFSGDEMLPAAAQGVLGIECQENNSALLDLLQQLNDQSAVSTTLAERAIARTLQASCQSPVAALAEVDGEDLTLSALVAHPDGKTSLRDVISGTAANAESLGETLAHQLLDRGAAEILRAADAIGADADGQ